MPQLISNLRPPSVELDQIPLAWMDGVRHTAGVLAFAQSPIGGTFPEGRAGVNKLAIMATCERLPIWNKASEGQ